jgi:hypothetical protein
LDCLDQNRMRKDTSPALLIWSGTVWFLSLRPCQAALSRRRIPWPGCTSWRSSRLPVGYWKSYLGSRLLAWMERLEQCIIINRNYIEQTNISC